MSEKEFLETFLYYLGYNTKINPELNNSIDSFLIDIHKRYYEVEFVKIRKMEEIEKELDDLGITAEEVKIEYVNMPNCDEEEKIDKDGTIHGMYIPKVY